MPARSTFFTAERRRNLYFVSFEGLNAATYRLDGTERRIGILSPEFCGRITPPFTLSTDGRRVGLRARGRDTRAKRLDAQPHDISQSVTKQITHFTEHSRRPRSVGQRSSLDERPGVEVEGLLIKPHGYVEGERFPLLASGAWRPDLALEQPIRRHLARLGSNDGRPRLRRPDAQPPWQHRSWSRLLQCHLRRCGWR